ncbi:hypothetical protein [Natrinema thermotolerans]|uniref:hypothetical protein n=1 Tax=Natrinema thermotolerans TaxID=121872 RepID=UPI000678C5E4|nr:hypothetical protein [Natrinema thermotolerans]QCC57275.1 hypothetical protein DVR14_00955 [Natrinema thermotolerans]
MSVPYAASATVDRPDDDILELTGGENPLTFLSMAEPDTALGVISWMDDPDRIDGWRRAEIESDGEPRKTILKALAKQERALEADATLPVYHDRHRRSTTIVDAESDDFEPETPETPTTTTDPVAATDGGQTVTEEPDDPDDDSDEATDETTDDLHPDVKGLAVGEVLVLERASPTEYIFPATPACDGPFLLRTADDETVETLTFESVLARLEGSPDPTPLAEIDVQAPAEAATNGGAE